MAGGNPYHDAKGEFTTGGKAISHASKARTGLGAKTAKVATSPMTHLPESKTFVRTEWAGNKNPSKDIKKAESISKKFGARVDYVADKGAQLIIRDMNGFKSAMRSAGIHYLLDDPT